MNHSYLLLLLHFSIIKIIILSSLYFPLPGFFLLLSFLKVHCFECSHNPLATSLYFLDNTDGCFHICIQSTLLLNNLLFGQSRLFEIDQELLYYLISFLFVRDLIMHKISGNMHLYLCRPEAHFKQKLIKVYILRSNCIGAGVVSYEIKLDFNYS